MNSKQANWLDDLKQRFYSLEPYKGYAQGASLGGALGATLAGLASVQNAQDGDSPAMRRRRILRNALTGGVLGAGAGLTLPALADTFSNMAPQKTNDQLAADRLKATLTNDKPLGGWLGHALGGGAAQVGATRWNRRRVLNDVINQVVNPTMIAAQTAHRNTSAAVDAALDALRSNTNSTMGNANALDDAITDLIQKDPMTKNIVKFDANGKFTQAWNDAWANKSKLHKDTLRTLEANKIYDPLVRETLPREFNRSGGRGQGVVYGGFGPKSLFSKLWGNTFGRLAKPSPDQLGVLLNPDQLGKKPGIALPAAIQHLDDTMGDIGKAQKFKDTLTRSYSGTGVNTRMPMRGHAVVALGATAPWWVPSAFQMLTGAKATLGASHD